MPANVFSEVIRPALADREGWLFIGTPNGKNQFYEAVQRARGGEPGWLYAEYKASQTGILSSEPYRGAVAAVETSFRVKLPVPALTPSEWLRHRTRRPRRR